MKVLRRSAQKLFEQCAGFLRIKDGDDPLDASAVHPGGIYPQVGGKQGKDFRRGCEGT